ncbi:MAG: HIT domain-containing protein [Acidimicrobiales bacterium]
MAEGEAVEGAGPRGGLARLWAGWRHAYVADIDAVAGTTTEGTVFERILAAGLDDSVCHILWRGRAVFAILNAYPYATGHLMVLPFRPVAQLGDLTTDESLELWEAVGHGVAAVEEAYSPEGMNVGMNLGAAGGAGVPDHIHVHVVPRWGGDTNFMTSVAEARVLPEPLDETWRRLRAAWPVPDADGAPIPSKP